MLLDRDATAPDNARLGPLVSVHRIEDRPGVGLSIIRPDGYVGYRSASVDPDAVASWLSLIGVKPHVTKVCNHGPVNACDATSDRIEVAADERGDAAFRRWVATCLGHARE